MPVIASAPQVLDAVQDVNRGLERQAEVALVRGLVEDLGTGMVVFGLNGVLDAVNGKRTHALVIREGVQAAGGECAVCGRLLATPVPAGCPDCGARLHPRTDLIARLEHAVLEQGGRVEEVKGDAAAALSAHGGIAARVRYALPTPTVLGRPTTGSAERPRS